MVLILIRKFPEHSEGVVEGSRWVSGWSHAGATPLRKDHKGRIKQQQYFHRHNVTDLVECPFLVFFVNMQQCELLVLRLCRFVLMLLDVVL